MGLHIAASKSHYTDLVDQTIKALISAHVLREGAWMWQQDTDGSRR